MGELELFEDVSNPLDSVEDMLRSQDWAFTRTQEEELTVDVTGKRGQYKMTFIWQEEFNAMQFFCEFDFTIAEERRETTNKVLRAINEDLWLGHFDVPKTTNAPSFRHTSLFRGWTQTSGAEHVEDLVDIAIAESDRFQRVFRMLANKDKMDDSLISFIMSDSAGEA